MQACKNGGDGASIGFFENGFDVFTCLHLFFAKHGLIFVLVKGITTEMVLRHLLYAHLINFEFEVVAWAQVRTITSETSFKWKLLVSTIFLKIC